MNSGTLLTRETARTLRCIPAMPTVFGADGMWHEDASICWDGQERLIEFLLKGGVDAVLWAGTTGEASTMIHTEQGFGTRKVVELVGGRVPVIAGAGANSTKEAVDLTEGAMEMGASTVLTVMPYYNRPTPKGQLAHFMAIAATGAPMILYSVPSRTGREIDLEVVATLARECPNILGIKEAGDFGRFAKLRRLCPKDFIIWSGNDDATLQAMLDGNCDGAVSVVANAVPALIKEMVDHLVAERNGETGRNGQAVEINLKLEDLMKALFIESNPIPVKKALQLMEVIEEAHYRLPIVQPETETVIVLSEALAELNLLPVTV